MTYTSAKRALDAVGALLLLGLVAPAMVLISVAIVLDNGWPPLLRQRRIGRFGKTFLMFKFRSMRVGTPEVAKSELQGHARHITRVGQLLRSSSLDELPQLVNVLVGDMSLVGPRPALHTQHLLVELRAQQGAMSLRPGLTGLAQVNGRENTSLDDKVTMDAQYVRDCSLALDVWILARTLPAVLSRRGAR